MPVRDRTILDNTLSSDTLNQRISAVEEELSSVKSGVHFVGEFTTYALMASTLLTPQDSDWVFITSDETKGGIKTQYIYNSSISEWKYAGGATSVNDATDTVKGVLRLSGDLSGTANNPQLSSVITGGTYAFGNNTVTVDSKGRLINIISGTTAYEWTFHSKPTVRSSATRTLTVPSYNTASAMLMFFYNGLLIPEPDNYTRLNSTTIVTNFIIGTDDDILILNTKFVGSINSSAIVNDLVLDTTTTYSSNKLNSDFAKLTSSIIPKNNILYDIGSAAYSYKDGYFYNSPIITSMRSKKKEIENNELGLEFVNNILSNTYKMIDGNRSHKGFIADSMKTTMDLFDVDFGVYIKDENGNEALRYEELIPIMWKAIQDLTPWYKKIYYKIKKHIRERKLKRNE
jgi:hypothetical protein